jgi:DNA-binding LacI/PurR family transcriptional regulator
MRELLYISREPTPSGMIGLLVPELSNPIFPALAQAMEQRATKKGYVTILCNTAGAAAREADYVRTLLARRVEGMIFISSEVTDLRSDHSHYLRLRAEGAKFVFVNGSAESLDVTSVGVDERAAARLATEHLLRLGHQRIAFAAGDPMSLPTRQKAEGRVEALRAAGIEPDGLVAYTSFAVEGGREALKALLEVPGPAPTGIICSNDLMAIGVIREAADRGIKVPADLSVVGFDGIEAADWSDPSLTTVEQPIEEIAETAVDALDTLISESSPSLPNYVFRPRLRVGGSTDSAPVRSSAKGGAL